MIIAESLLDKRDCTAAEVVIEQPFQAPCLAPLVSSICLLRPRGEGPRPDFSYCGHSFSPLLFFLSQSFCPSPSPRFPPPPPSPSSLFLGRISWWLPLFASLSVGPPLASSLSSSSSREPNDFHGST